MSGEHFPMSEVERTAEMGVDIRVEKLTDKLGYGEGGISYAERKPMLSPGILEAVESAVQSPDILVPIDTDKSGNLLDDDGCGDGRGVKRIFEGSTELDEQIPSLNRAKVFGGGATMALASRIGLGEVSKPLDEAFTETMSIMDDKMLDAGAHTADNPHGAENSGCGAIDKAPTIINNALKYEGGIRESIAALGFESDGLDDIFANYRSYSTVAGGGQSYSGKKVSDAIMKKGKIVKELHDDHREIFVVLNTVKGKTVNQGLIRRISKTPEAPLGEAQVFAVDVPRLFEIAEKLYSDPAHQKKAVLSELVYTLSTAATLTLGDLPVYVVSDIPATVAA